MRLVRRPVHGGWSAALVRFWVRCYASGLPGDLRDERQAEVDSDLWEHSNDSVTGHSTVSGEILARGLLGAPADLSWRLERSRLAMLPGRLVAAVLGLFGGVEAAGRWIGRRGLPGVTTAAGVLAGLLGMLVIVTAPGNDAGTPAAELVRWGLLVIIAAVALIAGGRTVDAHPRLGGGLTLAASAALGLLLWPTLVAPIAALGLGWRAIVRIRRAGRDRAPHRSLDL